MKLISLILLISILISPSFAQDIEEDIIEVEISNIDDDTLEAKITSFSDKAKESGLDEISILGTAQKDQDVLNISWEELKLVDEKSKLANVFVSKVILTGDIENGDTFKAKGDYQDIAQAVNNLLDQQFSSQDSFSSGNFGNFTASGTDSSNLSALSSDDYTAAIIGTEEAISDQTTTTDGCSLRVDYELNRVYVQQKTLLNGSEIETCYDSEIFYLLEKDYDSPSESINTT